jgi:hypothetical protein
MHFQKEYVSLILVHGSYKNNSPTQLSWCRIVSHSYCYENWILVLVVQIQIFYNIFGIHRDSHHWKNPNSFSPELHFNYEEVQRRHQYAFLPWSVGERYCNFPCHVISVTRHYLFRGILQLILWIIPRKCIGMNLALFQTKLTLCSMYRNFVLRYSNPQQPVTYTAKNIFLVPKIPPQIRVIKRNKGQSL